MIPLRLYVNLETYGVGDIEDSQSAIARPYRRLFEEGIDPGRMSYLLIRSTSTSEYKVLGALCETTGQRLLFFPGGRIRRLNTLFSRKSATRGKTLDGIVDHITFEINTRRGHITDVTSNGKREVALNIGRRRDLGQHLYAWFGITLSSLSPLGTVPGKLWFSTEYPVSDADRRLELYRKAGKASRVYVLPVDHVTPGTFLQINFFVDFAPNQSTATIRAFLPNGPPELEKAIDLPATISTPVHGMSLQESIGMIRIQPIVWRGAPTQEVLFGF